MPIGAWKQVAHLKTDGGDDVLWLAAGETFQQHLPVLTFTDRETVAVVRVSRTEGGPSDGGLLRA